MKSKTARLITDICVFAMLGSIMFVSKIVMEFLPNIHLLGMFTVVYTLVYRSRALIPIYVYVFLNGIYGGFNVWWMPYLYIWTLLWGVTMLLPKRMPKKISAVIYSAVCALHGLCFGVLYAPAQAIMFGLDFAGTVGWIIAGIPYDLIHMVGNLITGCLIIPIKNLLFRLAKQAGQI